MVGFLNILVRSSPARASDPVMRGGPDSAKGCEVADAPLSRGMAIEIS